MTRNIRRYRWGRWLVFLVALEIISLSINFFYAPIDIAAGGTTGIAILVEAVWHVERPLTVLICNLAMIGLAWIFLERKVVKNITLGSLLLPVFMQLTPSFQVTDNELLAVIIGGGLMGFGVSLLYRINASSGGTTVPPMILKKYFYLDSALTLMFIDLLVIFMNIFVAGPNAFFLAAFSQVITALVMRYSEAGFDLKYQVQILSNDLLDEIKETLLKDNSSLTLYDVVGGYSQTQKQQILLIVDRQDYGHLIAKIHEIDPEAFIVTSNVTKVHGGKWGL